MRSAMGIAVFFGMLGVTVFGLMLTPVFYVLVRMMAGGSRRGASSHNENPRVLGKERGSAHA
jgi:multidrug efflux pump